jgi:hypothetical protein
MAGFFSQLFLGVYTKGGFKGFLPHWTNSILQQLERKFWKIEMHCSEFQE